MAESAKETAEPPKKPKPKLIWILAGLFILLLLGGGGFWGFRYYKGSKPAAAGQGAQQEKAKKSEMKATLHLEPFLVNLADKDTVRFVKVTFQLGLADATLGEELSKEPVVLAATRDTIISLLSSKTAEEILTPAGKEKLREEVRNRVNAVLPRGKVGEVYITDFVVQL
jgi:flagellar FliL protein